MATYNSAGSGNFNVDATWTETGHPSTGDTAVIASGHTVTMTADDAVGSIDIQGTLTTDGTARTLTLDANAQGYICEHRGTVSTTINLVINSDFAGNKLIRLNGTSGNFNDVSITLQSSSRVLEYVENTTIDGDLTINVGEFQHFSSSFSLDVQGDCTINNTGKLDGGAGSIELGSLTINSGGTYVATSGTTTITNENSSNYAIQNNGTFTHNSGTVSIETADHTSMAWSSANQRFNNLTINLGASARSFTQAGGIGDTDNKYIEGALQIINSTYNVNNLELRVDGDVTLSTNAVLNGATGDVKFGTLKVESGTTYNATSGTTSLNAAGQGHSGNPSAMEIVSGGTFTHNNGTIKFNGITDQDIEMDGTGNFYNLTLDKTNNDVIMHPNVTIENNLDVTLASDHTLRPASTSNTVTVLNQTILRAGQIGATTAYDANHNWGTLTILGGTFIVGSGTNEVTAIRNVGGTIS